MVWPSAGHLPVVLCASRNSAGRWVRTIGQRCRGGRSAECRKNGEKQREEEKAHQNGGGLCHTMVLILQLEPCCSKDCESSIKKDSKISLFQTFRRAVIAGPPLVSCRCRKRRERPVPELFQPPMRLRLPGRSAKPVFQRAGEGAATGGPGQLSSRYVRQVGRKKPPSLATGRGFQGEAARLSTSENVIMESYSLNRKCWGGQAPAWPHLMPIAQVSNRGRAEWRKRRVALAILLKSEIKNGKTFTNPPS